MIHLSDYNFISTFQFFGTIVALEIDLFLFTRSNVIISKNRIRYAAIINKTIAHKEMENFIYYFPLSLSRKLGLSRE